MPMFSGTGIIVSAIIFLGFAISAYVTKKGWLWLAICISLYAIGAALIAVNAGVLKW